MIRTLARTLPLSLSLSVSLLAACTGADEGADELAGEADEQTEGKADTISGTSTYFAISRDARRCAPPFCGGFQIDRVNASKTTCHDGSKAEACYTPELDWSEAGLSLAQQQLLVDKVDEFGNGVQALLRGRFKKTNVGTTEPTLGRFIVTEAWIGLGAGEAEGVFARVSDSGVRCIQAPCPSTRERALNSSRADAIAAVDYTAGGLTDDDVAPLWEDMYTTGVIVAGDRYTFKVQGRTGKGRTATNAYRNVANIAPTPAEGACFVGGCSGQVCSENEGIITTCEFRPEYACYATATCERQAGGECGWTQTAELAACIGDSL